MEEWRWHLSGWLDWSSDVWEHTGLVLAAEAVAWNMKWVGWETQTTRHRQSWIMQRASEARIQHQRASIRVSLGCCGINVTRTIQRADLCMNARKESSVDIERNASDEPNSPRWEHNSDLGCQTQRCFVVGKCQTAATFDSYNQTKEEDSVSS